MTLKVLHIVRRYGCVGGMERYVWELTHELAKLNCRIEVACETVIGIPSPAITIHQIKPSAARPRWKSMSLFRANVDRLISMKLSSKNLIIHSHERTLQHHITTFHGPPMQRSDSIFQVIWPNKRVNSWIRMEKDEILGSQVQVVLPVSNRIKHELVSLYPELSDKSIITAYPGVHQIQSTDLLLGKKNGSRFVFIGKEWKRKGLRLATEVIEDYASRFNFCTMDVYGPVVSDLPRYLRKHPNLAIKGWSNDIGWEEYDALIHPATNEPFGMVIPEARSHGVPVLTTNLVGSIELNYYGVAALGSCEPVGTWSKSLYELVHNKKKKLSETKWTWRQLALQHVKEIYPLVTIIR